MFLEGKREDVPGEKGKRESAKTEYFAQISLDIQAARTHARHETKRFPDRANPPTSDDMTPARDPKQLLRAAVLEQLA